MRKISAKNIKYELEIWCTKGPSTIRVDLFVAAAEYDGLIYSVGRTEKGISSSSSLWIIIISLWDQKGLLLLQRRGRHASYWCAYCAVEIISWFEILTSSSGNQMRCQYMCNYESICIFTRELLQTVYSIDAYRRVYPVHLGFFNRGSGFHIYLHWQLLKKIKM